MLSIQQHFTMLKTYFNYWLKQKMNWLTDWFNVPLDIEQVTSEMLFPANLLASNETIKLKPEERTLTIKST